MPILLPTLLRKSIFAAATMLVGLSAVASSAAVLVEKAPGGVGTDNMFASDGLWREVTIASPAGIETIGVGLYTLQRTIDAGAITPLSTFCIEVDQFIDLPSTYAVSLLAAAFTNVGQPAADKAAAIARLWALRFDVVSNELNPNFDGLTAIGADSKDRAAAFQLALWEIQLDGAGGTLDTGNFQIGAANLAETDLVALTNKYLAFAADTTNTTLANIWALTSDTSQNLVIPGSPNGGGPSGAEEPVPAPAPLALLGAALAGLAALRRRA